MAHNIQNHTSPWDDLASGAWQRAVMLKILSVFLWMIGSNGFLFSLATLIVGSSFALSVTTDAWHWFQRSGALLVSIGAIFSTRQVLRSTINAMLHTQDSGEMSPPEQPLDDSVGAACLIGFCMVGIGTLTWAYGDLTGCLLGSSCL